ncbi:MAG: DUF3347 domain-containing protein [Leptospiraceae bacterium]|nr:DUF3347 domain-containing protein [Leptospiraceae bacterium]
MRFIVKRERDFNTLEKKPKDIIMKYVVIILFFILSCKAEMDGNLKTAILKILTENQKVHELMLAKPDNIPEINMVLIAVKEAKSLALKNENIKKDLEKLELILTNVNSKDKDAFFESLSSFSEIVTDILKVNKIQTQYNKFYCPMVSKYWIAKGELVENPYAPEMRECGELVK